MNGSAADMLSGEDGAAPTGDGGAAAADGKKPELHIGQEVAIAQFQGTVRFVGATEFAAGTWVGIELKEAVGKNNGTVQGVAYFACPPQHGIFVREAVVKPLEPGAAAEERPQTAATSRDSSDGDSEQEGAAPARTGRQRRYGVSAESAARVQGGGDSSWTPPFHAKDPKERSQLSEMIQTSHDGKLRMMFGGIRAETFEKVVDAMFHKQVPAGEKVIKYGDHGDFFYIVKTGQFDIHARKVSAEESPAPAAASDEPQLVKVFEAGAGFAFGELALLYNAPRSATIVATEASEVWCLEREAFRRLVVQSFEDQFKEYVDFIKRCDIFAELSSEQVASLAEVLEEEDFEEDEAILEQGGRDNKMYIILRGTAVACIAGDQGEVEVMRYKEGDYFGEIALLLGEPRKASVYAMGPTTCMYITRDTFNRVLGPLRDFLQRNIGRYQKYQDAIVSAQQPDIPVTSSAAGRKSRIMTRQSLFASDADEVFCGGVQKDKLDAKQKRFRMRTVAYEADPPETSAAAAGEASAGEAAPGEAAGECAPGAAAGGGGSAGEGGPKPPGKAMSLAEKVAADFLNPKLVSPEEAFLVPKSTFEMFGGLRPGQKFTEDKVVVDRTQVKPTQDGLQNTYSWHGPTCLKGSTQISVLCQKGQKSASDPTPNQDNYFVLHIGSVSIYGVCDGHGPFGHLVSFRLVQTLPHLLATNPNFGKDWALALKEAFVNAQRDLLRFCAEQDVNLEASGSAGSVLVLDGASIHVAHIGDAGAMVASYNRRDSRLIFGTEDHKPQKPQERERLESAGSEVRELDKDSYRIYIRGTNFPGLTMSRAFGDTACAGVIQEPEYHSFFMQPGDEYYAIIASDGIWEFLEYDKVVDLTAKKLRLKGPQETVRFLTEASRKRWAYCCGDYCDDITVLLVQWNVKDKNGTSDENHSLTVTRDQ